MIKKIKDVASSSTMSDKAKKWRKIAVITFGVASVLVSPLFPYTLPVSVINAATVIQLLGITTGLGAQTNTGKKKI